MRTTDDGAADVVKGAINSKDVEALNKAIDELEKIIKTCKGKRAIALRKVLKLAGEARALITLAPLISISTEFLLPEELNAAELEDPRLPSPTGSPCPDSVCRK